MYRFGINLSQCGHSCVVRADCQKTQEQPRTKARRISAEVYCAETNTI